MKKKNSHKKWKPLYAVLACCSFSGCFFLNSININANFCKEKMLERILAHYAWHNVNKCNDSNSWKEQHLYCLRIQKFRHWLLLFSTSGLDQWETDPTSWSQLSCQLHSWHKGTCEYHTISTFNPASNPIHLNLQSNKRTKDNYS